MSGSSPAARSLQSRAERSLERALLFNFCIHGLALLAMAALLLPLLPGGSAASDAERVAAIAAHPWRFRLGWLPWQACAAADLWLAFAMLRVRWLSRVGAACVAIFTLAAVFPDQYAQAVWVTRGVELARSAPSEYLAFERAIFPLTAGWGALFYTLAALGWTWCFLRAGTWSRALSVLSLPLWLTMLVAVVSPLLPVAERPSPKFVSIANGLGFLQLQVWLGLLTEAVLRRARPFEPFGRFARWRYPSENPLARLVDGLANSRLFGEIFGRLPAVTMQSEITNVIYVSYLLRANVLAPWVPSGLELERLGPSRDYALFSFLTYRHGHFGFAFMGSLRKWFPSPLQSNWRIHVRDPRTGLRGIHFLTNAITHLVPALGARLLTEGMPMHVFQRAELTRSVSGELYALLDPGKGSAPDAEISVRPLAEPPELRGAWAACFGSFRDFLAYCVPQDRAMASQPLRGRISRQEIELGISPDDCELLVGSVRSRAAEAIAGAEEPLCFRVPAVAFTFASQEYDDLPETA